MQPWSQMELSQMQEILKPEEDEDAAGMLDLASLFQIPSLNVRRVQHRQGRTLARRIWKQGYHQLDQVSLFYEGREPLPPMDRRNSVADYPCVVLADGGHRRYAAYLLFTSVYCWELLGTSAHTGSNPLLCITFMLLWADVVAQK